MLNLKGGKYFESFKQRCAIVFKKSGDILVGNLDIFFEISLKGKFLVDLITNYGKNHWCH